MNKLTLYKLDANNGVREWTVWTEPTLNGYQVVIRHGSQIGQQQMEVLGGFDEKTVEVEAQRRIDYMKNRRGYSTTIPVSRPIRPMLAQTYTPNLTRLPSTFAVQPKLNGVRCFGSKKWMKSRTNTYFTSCPHIQATLSQLPDDILLDGELYCHGASFQEISSWTRTDGENPNSHKIKYHVFDIADESLPYIARMQLLSELFESSLLFRPGSNLELVEASIIDDDTYHLVLEANNRMYLDRGYEGTMIRFLDKPYEFNVRSYGLYKYKPVITGWFIITDVLPGKSGRGKSEGVLRCKAANGLYFNAALAMPNYTRVQILNSKHQVIGKSALIEYRDYTEDELPSHAVAKEIR